MEHLYSDSDVVDSTFTHAVAEPAPMRRRVFSVLLVLGCGDATTVSTYGVRTRSLTVGSSTSSMSTIPDIYKYGGWRDPKVGNLNVYGTTPLLLHLYNIFCIPAASRTPARRPLLLYIYIYVVLRWSQPRRRANRA